MSTTSWTPRHHAPPSGGAPFQNRGRPSTRSVSSVVTAQTFDCAPTAVTPKGMRHMGAFEPANVSQNSSSPSAVSFASVAPESALHPTGNAFFGRGSSPSKWNATSSFPNEIRPPQQVNDNRIPAQFQSRCTPRLDSGAQNESEDTLPRGLPPSNSAPHRTSTDIQNDFVSSTREATADESQVGDIHTPATDNAVPRAPSTPNLPALPVVQLRRKRHVDLVWNVDGTPLLDHNDTAITVDRYLATKPLKADLSTRPGPGNRKLTYMSGEAVTRTLNEVFGYDGWCLDIKSTNREENWKDDQGRHHVSYTATVRLTLRQSGVYKEDCGAGDAIDKVLGTAVANALKASVTDAMKRAARHFGEKLGNSLYQGSFNVNKAPNTLKDALDGYDIEHANSKFGFRSKRKAAPGASCNSTKRDSQGAVDNEHPPTKRPNVNPTSGPGNPSEGQNNKTSSNSVNRYATQKTYSNAGGVDQTVSPNTASDNGTAHPHSPHLARDPYNRDKSHTADGRSRTAQQRRVESDQQQQQQATSGHGVRTSNLGAGPDLTVFSANAQRGLSVSAPKSNYENNRNGNAPTLNQGQASTSETDVPEDFFDIPRPPTSRGRPESGPSSSRPRNCGEEATRGVPPYNPYQ